MSLIVPWNREAAHLGRCVIVMGVFDGVHLGHQSLLCDAARRAHNEEARFVALTFDRDPEQVLSPTTAAPQLLDLEDKIRFLTEYGADAVVVVPFTQAVAEMQPEEFVQEVILSCMTPVLIIVGNDFRFGAGAAGDVQMLERIGVRNDFEVHAHYLVKVDGDVVTSTRIRSLVAAGDVEGAARLLGHPHRLRGFVVHGKGLGTSLGAATANITTPTYVAFPSDGVYAGKVRIGPQHYPVAISVGGSPTFGEGGARIEVHVIGYEGDLYGRELTVEFIQRLRDHHEFASGAELTAAIATDIKLVEAIVGLRPTGLSPTGAV